MDILLTIIGAVFFLFVCVLVFANWKAATAILALIISVNLITYYPGFVFIVIFIIAALFKFLELQDKKALSFLEVLFSGLKAAFIVLMFGIIVAGAFNTILQHGGTGTCNRVICY